MMYFNKKSLQAASAVWMRNFILYKRRWHLSILPNFFEPFLYLLGMGIGLGFYMKEGIAGSAYLAYIGPGLIAASAMNGASFECTWNVFVRMHRQKIYNAYIAAPALIGDVALGEALWAITRAFLYGFVFFLIVLSFTLMGFPIVTSKLAILAPLPIVLTGAVFTAIGMCFTALITVMDYYSYYFTLFLTPLFLFSGIFYPVDRFPLGAQIAWYTPLYHCVRLCRGIFQGPFTPECIVSALWLIVVTALLLALMPRLFKRRLID